MAADLKASDAYVRRLLIRQRLYGVKVGQVWAVYSQDLEDFKRLRRPRGRPAQAPRRPDGETEIRRRITQDRAEARTDRLLRKPKRTGRATRAHKTGAG